MPSNKSTYIKYRWQPAFTRFNNQARRYEWLNIGLTIVTISTAAGALIIATSNPIWQVSLFAIALITMSVNLLYEFKERGRQYRRIAEALRRERELFEAEVGVYSDSERAFDRFSARCEAIIQASEQRFTPLILENLAEEPKETLPASRPDNNPFDRSSSLRNRLGSSRFSSDTKNDTSQDDNSSESDRPRPRFGSSGSNPFGSRSGGSSPFSNRTGGTFGSRPGNSPFGSNARFSGGRPIGSSGGMRREGKDDPALSGIQTGNGKTGVRFTAYYPKEILPNEWQPIKAYAYMGYAVDAIHVDSENGDPDKLPEILYDRNRNVRYRIPEGAQVTITPVMAGFQFNPANVTIGFYRPWHRFDFEIRATDTRQDEATNGYLTFSIDGLVVADVPMSIYVGRGLAKNRQDPIRQVTRKPYRSVYAAFAEQDAHLAERFEQIYDALGMYAMRDVMQQRAKGDWNPEMLSQIDEAEVFQLFWSEAAANSETVHQELEYALQLKSEHDMFIRPVYWELPPVALPDNLASLKSAYMPDIAD